MSLLEVVTGMVLFVMTAGSSLQLWAMAGAAAHDQARRQQRMDQLEAAVLRAETSLRSLAPSHGDCPAAAQRLMKALAAQPLSAGLERRLARSPAGDGVVLSLTAEGEAGARQRLYLPAALGLCGAPLVTAPVPPQVTVPAPLVVTAPVPSGRGSGGAF
jgi:hypothetical protein